MEGPESPKSQSYIDPDNARSSVARDFDREANAPTPGVDDTPYVRFAIDQLTVDEEVRGSRTYPGNTIYEYDQNIAPNSRAQGPQQWRPSYGTAAAGIGAAAAAGGAAYAVSRPTQNQPMPSEQWPDPSRRYDESSRDYRRISNDPPRDYRRVSSGGQDVPVPVRDYQRFSNGGRDTPVPVHEPALFIPVSNEGRHHTPLDFMPALLQPLALGLFILLIVILLALLLLASIWSLTHKGIVKYGSLGDGKYFVFEYLPTMLAMLLFIWLVQVQVAVYRIAPFIALSSESSRAREQGARLPMCPKTFFLPYLGHFKAKQAVIGIFMFIGWLQIWTIPLIATAFNVYYFGSPANGQWRWISTTSIVWVVIFLYVLLLIATIVLLIWLRKQQTGLRWDPRSIADVVVLLERSNALSMTEEEELQYEVPRLGYWRTSRTENNIFQSYGVPNKYARQYDVESGRIREKSSVPVEPSTSRFSDPDMDLGREQRHSREKMIPKHVRSEDHDPSLTGGRAIPWFLKTVTALLWIIIAVVLLIAFLVVSYLQATGVSYGFKPAVGAAVGTFGYSTTNFLYSFIPAIISMICFLGLLDIDYAFRRLQAYSTLMNEDGEVAEKSILLSYVADMPVLVSLTALANGHIRVALLSFSSLMAVTLPIIGGGVFWAQFYIGIQNVRISADMTAYYALSFFVVVYALTYLLVFPSKNMRKLDDDLPYGNRAQTFSDLLALVHQSKMLDDIMFHAPSSKIDLVTRLLSAPHRAGQRMPSNADLTHSKPTVADNMRGFGKARQHAGALGFGAVPRYGLGRYTGRDGRDYPGIDRVLV